MKWDMDFIQNTAEAKEEVAHSLPKEARDSFLEDLMLESTSEGSAEV